MTRLIPISILISCTFCLSYNNVPYPPEHTQLSNYLSEQELDEIRHYAEQFRFEEFVGSGFIVAPEKPNPAAKEAIKHAAEIGEEHHLPYAALFILRLYHEHKRRYYQSYCLDLLKNIYPGQYEGQYDLAYEFLRLTNLQKSDMGYQTHSCYDWVKENESLFINYPPVI